MSQVWEGHGRTRGPAEPGVLPPEGTWRHKLAFPLLRRRPVCAAAPIRDAGHSRPPFSEL